LPWHGVPPDFTLFFILFIVVHVEIKEIAHKIEIKNDWVFDMPSRAPLKQLLLRKLHLQTLIQENKGSY
jgi:hypothetical protein